ncbi:alpha/beta fold hydrolase [Chachezhania antarctica]|uniref:alpha/beta fold hydrolase n=1 Tax=Chachezhania antarctica TaxID=2340860 RepID=UPI000EB30160|nr:alpha/beta hydrolase [Chachezhania antarctica]|tara:strand:- start:10726 stop:11553 length:828 start_codon:yes stop_codon:yes gene_type:complete
MALDWSADPKTPLTVDGVTLEYACFGREPGDAAPTIVLLHEGLGSAALWRDFPARLADRAGCGVFVYSRQGYGQSDPTELPKPLDFMTREAVDVLPHVLDAIGAERFILFGHSDGATIAALHAGNVQDHRIRAMILMAPHFFTEDMGLAEIAKARTAFADTDMRAKMAKYHRDPEGAFRGWNDVWLHPDFKAWNVADTIDYIRVPVLAIQGRDDQYGSLAQIEVIDERSYAPVEMLVIDHCRHAPHLEQPEAVLAGVSGFIDHLEEFEAARVETA